MTCERCSNGGYVVKQIYLGVESFECMICGETRYPDFPKREAPGNVCEVCGEEYDRKNVLQMYCPSCKKLIGKNISKAMPKIAFPKALPYSDKKLEAARGLNV